MFTQKHKEILIEEGLIPDFEFEKKLLSQFIIDDFSDEASAFMLGKRL